jgi:ribosomal protein S18 acetylase RimI-like enzyme
MAGSPALTVRPLARRDLAEVVRIDAARTGTRKPAYWQRVLGGLSRRGTGGTPIALAAITGQRLAGYVVGDVRAFEFGSEPCGWVVAIAVDTPYLRTGVASALLAHACAAFRRAGVTAVRTMVRRDDVPVLAFFRSNGFAAGSYVQLEADLGKPVGATPPKARGEARAT